MADDPLKSAYVDVQALFAALPDDLEHYRRELQGAMEDQKNGRITMAELSERIRESATVLLAWARDVKLSHEEVARMTTIFSRLGRTLRDIEESHKKMVGSIASTGTAFASIGDAVTSSTGLVKGMGDGVSKFGGAVSSCVSPMSALGPAAAIAGGAIQAIATASVALVAILDKVSEANKDARGAIIQYGADIATGRKNISDFRDAIVAADDKLGFSAEQSGALAMSLAQMGIVVDGHRSKTERAVTATDAMATSVEAVKVLNRGYHVELGKATGLVGMLGTRFDQVGKEVTDSAGTIMKNQRGPAEFWIKNVMAMGKATEMYGTPLAQVIEGTRLYTDMIRKGTMTAQDAAKWTEMQTMGIDKQVAMLDLVNQYLPEEARLLELTNDSIEDNYRLNTRGTKEQKEVMGDLTRRLMVAMTKEGAGGEGPGHMDLFLRSLAPSFGKQIQSFEQSDQLMKGQLKIHQDTANEQTKLAKTGKDAYESMKKNAQENFDTFGKITERFNKTIAVWGTAIEDWRGKVMNPQTKSDVELREKSIGVATTGVGAMLSPATGMAPLVIELARLASRSSGGIAPGSLTASPRSGTGAHTSGASNVNVSVGSVNIAPGEGGDVRDQIHRAISDLENKIVEQWHKAKLAN